MKLGRREFLTETMAFGALAGRAAWEERPLKFLFMIDTHIERDFWEGDHPVYTCWKPGNHAALVKTYAFINEDPYCRDIDFAFFCGDQLNTGYTRQRSELDAEFAIWNETLAKLDIHARTRGEDLSSFRFVSEPYTCRENLGRGDRPFDVTPPMLESRVIAIQGNHDTGVPAFHRDCAFTCGGTRFIAFFASYVGLPPPPGKKYHSTGAISDKTLEFLAREMSAASADADIRHIVLFCHWAIAPAGGDFIHPIVDACPSNKMNDNRRKLLELCEKYGCDLFVNGHEHNSGWPIAKMGRLSDINCGTIAGPKGSFGIVEIHADKAVFNVYSRAFAEERDGRVVYTQMPTRLFTREIALKSLH